MDKSLSVLRHGKAWFSRLLAGLIEAGRTKSYVETYNPSQSDTFHKAIKEVDAQIFKREFEKAVKSALKALRFGRVKVAIDVTEDPYWGEHGSYNTRAKVHEKSNESWQYINLSIVEPKFIPLMSIPYRQIDNLTKLSIDLLEYLRTLPLRVNLVLFDRGFYIAELIDYLENKKGKRPLPYLIFVPKNEAIKRYIEQTEKLGIFRHEMHYKMKKSGWRTKTTIVICKQIWNKRLRKKLDWCFATNQRASLKLVRTYRKRWNIETGFRIQDEVQIKSKSSNPLIRYFYHLLSMLMILVWKISNKIKHYQIFKRFLKLLEISYWSDPPNQWI
jgi:hypothetical protein